MSLIDAVAGIQARPDCVAVLLGRHTIRLGVRGLILNALKPGYVYPHLSAGDVLAQTWEVWTPEQIEQLRAAGAMG